MEAIRSLSSKIALESAKEEGQQLLSGTGHTVKCKALRVKGRLLETMDNGLKQAQHYVDRMAERSPFFIFIP